MTERIFIYGASGHGKVVLDAARQQGLDVLAVFDDNPALAGTFFMNCAVIGGRDALRSWCQRYAGVTGIVAIGQNRARAAVAGWLVAAGFKLTTVIHPRATVASDTEIGVGSVLMAGAVINSGTTLGNNCIINTCASVDHDCVIGDFTHVAPGARLCGNVRVGSGVLIGAGSTLLPGVVIGDHAVVGAGSTVIRDVPAGLKVAGSPCRELR